jgi:hypothetical protein
MLTPPEQALLEKVRTMINRLSEAELQLDETMFILQLYLSYQVWLLYCIVWCVTVASQVKD